MKDWQKHLVTFLIGAGAAMCLCLTCNPRVGGKDVLVQSDTIVKYETLHYSRLELAKNTIKLDVPKVGTKKFVFIEESSLDTIYRDCVRYVTLPREYFYTKQDDVEIWHSGIDSRIDSLRYTKRETVVTDTYKRRDWRHEVQLYGSVGYHQGMRIPVGVEYSFYPKRWIGIGGKAEYDISTKTTGVYAKANIRFGW